MTEPGPMGEESPWWQVIDASERMAAARTLDGIVEILRETARGVAASHGVTVVLRDGDMCHYVAEDAVSPLWAGQRFPAVHCVSGWAMSHGRTVAIPDVSADPRVPFAAYEPTFVRSMVMVPIGRPEPVAAIGAYWSHTGPCDPAVIRRLEALARSATLAIENARHQSALERMAQTLELRVEERTRELAAAQDALRQSQKLEAMGQITGGVAHDFNNLLTPIIGGLDMLRRGELGPRETRWVEAAILSADRCKSLVQRLLAFARRQPLTPEPIDVAAILADFRGLLSGAVGPGVKIAIEVEANLPLAASDRTQLETALLNLVLNARDAMSVGGTVSIRASSAQVGPYGGKGLSPGDYVLLEIVDDGSGMDEATLSRAVEPFFSTKGVGRGTGLGLSMAHGLASQLGGGLFISSVLGAGTTVEFWMPVSDERRFDRTPQRGAVRLQRRGGVVLLVDDEDLVRESAAGMLSDLGFEVVEAASGERALAELAARSRIDLLVTDNLMPGMSGLELANLVKSERPEMPILLMSGFTEVEAEPPAAVRLRKPFRQAELEECLSVLLG